MCKNKLQKSNLYFSTQTIFFNGKFLRNYVIRFACVCVIHILVQKWHTWGNILAQTGWISFKRVEYLSNWLNLVQKLVTKPSLSQHQFCVVCSVAYVVSSDSIFAFFAAEVFVVVGELDVDVVEDDSAIDRLQPARKKVGLAMYSNYQKTKNLDSLEYSGDLKSKPDRILNGRKEVGLQMVRIFNGIFICASFCLYLEG